MNLYKGSPDTKPAVLKLAKEYDVITVHEIKEIAKKVDRSTCRIRIILQEADVYVTPVYINRDPKAKRRAIEAWHKNLDLSTTKVAEQVGITQTTLDKIIADRRYLRHLTVENADWLLKESEKVGDGYTVYELLNAIVTDARLDEEEDDGSEAG